MRVGAELDTQAIATRRSDLEADARALAEQQRDIERAPRFALHAIESQRVARRLGRAQRHLAARGTTEVALQSTSEWFLDNYYLIRRVARQVEDDLPDGFSRRLPRLASGPARGRPRIEALARSFVARSSLMFDLASLRHFIDAYQQVSPLTIAELWALPTLLRTTVLAHLLDVLRVLQVPLHDRPPRPAAPSVPPEAPPVDSTSPDQAARTGVERAIRALRVLDAIDWKAFFEKTSRVEAILLTEPAQIYARMDFETCDAYRKVIEVLAWATHIGEEEVAQLAVTLARGTAPVYRSVDTRPANTPDDTPAPTVADARPGHVGFYLVAEGRRALEARLGYHPVGLDRVRSVILRWPTAAYLVALALMTGLPMLAVAVYLAAAQGAGLWAILGVVALAIVPASSVAVAVVNRLVAALLPPRTLPKLNFKLGLPPEARTLVVIPTLLGRPEDVAAMLGQIELHYLSNPDPQLQFALLTDDTDAKVLPKPSDDQALLESACEGIVALNARHGRDGVGPFHLLHRAAQWNQGEQRFMGWERKRGKLEELNRLLRGDADTSFARQVGRPEGLRGIRFVITLDSDTCLPMGAARRLVGLLAHPLNRAVFEAKTGRVIEDRVISPYASILAVAIRPHAVVENVVALEAMGMLGTYGMFEALDLTPERSLSYGARHLPVAVVRSYMAHHQGMLIVALGNVLNRRSMVERFHADALVETGEALLNERPPAASAGEWPVTDGAKGPDEVEIVAKPGPLPTWLAPSRVRPQAFVLSNGALTSLVTGAGGGGLRWGQLALTRYETDATTEGDGIWLYLRDELTRRTWLATSMESRTTYSMHKAELHLRSEGISVHVEITVAPADDVEVRRITLHNETTRPRQLTLTSAGRPVLFDAKQAPVHPAFSSMFVESEQVADLHALLFARRPQSADEEPAVLVHALVSEGRAVAFAGFQSDRGDFFGRGGSLKTPRVLEEGGSGVQGRVGTVIDPIMSLTARVDLAAKGSVTLAFVTTVARSRGAAVALARKYGSMHAVRWTFRDAEQENPRRLQRTRLEAALLPAVQQLYSALLFADPTLRVSPSARALNPPCQRRLWGYGISGDDPIVLLRVQDPDAPILAETFAAQRYLRSCGVRLDLVLIDQQASRYTADGPGTLRNLLTLDDVEDWLNRRGGVFVVSADQVVESELLHLEACARVVLDTRDHALGSRLERVVEHPPRLPRFEPTLAVEPSAAPKPRPALLFDNGIGGFTEDGREYVIEVAPGQSTPAPWCNVLAHSEFGCLVSESSLGTSWSLNAGENRLTPWRNDPVLDTPSEALYVRDEETAEVWSSTPLPAGRTGRTWIRHGAGYTIYTRTCHGLEQELTIFVPPGASLKVARLRVKNTLPRHRRLTATYYAEWVLGSQREKQRPFIVSEFERNHACLLATCSWNMEFTGRVAFVASRHDVHGYTADRTEFLGYCGDHAQPEGLHRWGLSGRVDLGADPCAALQVHLELEVGETIETHFILGQSADRDQALALIARFRDPAEVVASWQALQVYWDDMLGRTRVKTPEPSMDLMLNRWLLYQTLSARVFGRCGFYQSSGAFGYRDQLQDVLALLHAAPAIARAHILEAARHQFEEGDVLHWWHPPSGRGVRTRCSDDMAWLPYVVSEYVAATGDTGILNEQVPFLTAVPLRPEEHDRYAEYDTSAAYPLFDHCRRAIECALTEGAHGLPLMGDGDWNDGMSRVGTEGRGESVWLGWFLCATMDRFAALAVIKSDPALAARWRARAEALREKLTHVAWDGAWYLRAFHDDGSLVGSAQSRECRIDSIAQSWAVFSQAQAGDHEERAVQMRAAVRAADDELVRGADRLVLLFWPPFDGTLHDPGYIRAYPPGVRENGGQYTHAAAWLGLAHAALGDGERAERIFRLLNPALRVGNEADLARYRVEPYALAADIYSCPPWVGRGGWTWYTGSAAWTWRLGAEGILGLHKEGGQLRIEPCIPPSWPGFEAWVRLGQRTVHVVVENPDGVASGVATVTLDGVTLENHRIHLDPNTAGTHEVRVRLGRTEDAPPVEVSPPRADPGVAAEPSIP